MKKICTSIILSLILLLASCSSISEGDFNYLTGIEVRSDYLTAENKRELQEQFVRNFRKVKIEIAKDFMYFRLEHKDGSDPIIYGLTSQQNIVYGYRTDWYGTSESKIIKVYIDYEGTVDDYSSVTIIIDASSVSELPFVMFIRVKNY